MLEDKKLYGAQAKQNCTGATLCGTKLQATGTKFCRTNLQARGVKFCRETAARFFMDKDKALLHHIHRSKALNNLYV